jgi:hypothetical protein
VARYTRLDVHKGYIRGYEFQPYSLEGKHERHFRFPNTPAEWSQCIAGHPDRPRGDRKCLRSP